MVVRRPFVLVVLTLSVVVAVGPASAGEIHLLDGSVSWSAADYQEAVAAEFILVPAGTASTAREAEEGVATRDQVLTQGKRPTARLRPEWHQLFEPRPSASESHSTPKPEDVGSSKAHFSSSRVFPALQLAYPYSAIGKVFFQDAAGQSFVCSGSVIAPRIVLTAAHCVFTKQGFIADLRFVPAFREGAAPYGEWAAVAVLVPDNWVKTKGKLPNATDFAVVEVDDQNIGGQVRRVGDVVGWLGVVLGRLFPNHLHMVGFPGNIDSGLEMHQVAAGALKKGLQNTVTYGSDMMQGSSGGPWIQNLGFAGAGQFLSNPPNAVAGVTSFGSTSPSPKAAGSSTLDSKLAGIFAGICARRAGNC